MTLQENGPPKQHTNYTNTISTHLFVKGIVQGVGFRPFIYRLAKEHKLSGFVLNSTSGVEIEINGRESRINNFIEDITQDSPPAAIITSIKRTDTNCSPANLSNNFIIKTSAQTGTRTTLISPDLDVCSNCLEGYRIHREKTPPCP